MLHWPRISPKSEMRGSSQLLGPGGSRGPVPHTRRDRRCGGRVPGLRATGPGPARADPPDTQRRAALLPRSAWARSASLRLGCGAQPLPDPDARRVPPSRRRLHRRSESAERALPQRARTLRGATARGGPTYDRVSRRRTFAQRSDRAARAARPAARREPGAACDAHAWPSAGGGARDSRDGELAVRAGGPVAHRRASRPARRRRSAARGRAHLARDARSRSCLARRSQHLDRDGVQCAAGAATLGLSHETNRPAPPRLLPRRGARRIRSAGTHPACWCLHTDEEEP